MHCSSALILLVDGSRSCRHIFHSVLEWAGFRVLEADTGEEGLRLARELVPELVITEFPVQLPGYSSLTEAIRVDPRLSGTRILTVTAHALPHYREQVLRAGVDGFLTKPIYPRELLKEVQRFLPTSGLAQTS